MDSDGVVVDRGVVVLIPLVLLEVVEGFNGVADMEADFLIVRGLSE